MLYRNMPTNRTLKDQVIVITGASRGIGLAIAKRCARDHARIAILAKTAEPHPNLPGTIYTAAKEIEEEGGECLPIVCDIRFEDQVRKAMDQVVNKWGRIDILVNNASAISITGTEHTPMKKYDLMHSINGRGTFLCSKFAIPHMKNSSNPHILNLSPPLSLNAKWFQFNTAYTMSKYNMSMCTLGMAEELKPYCIAVNSLWPRTTIATAAISNVLGGDEMIRMSRTVDIMADAAYEILTSDSSSEHNTGNFYIDDEVLADKIPSIPNMDIYNVTLGVTNPVLDFFVDEPYRGFLREQKFIQKRKKAEQELQPLIAKMLYPRL